MDAALKRRLDVLIVLCSALLGLAVTALSVGLSAGVGVIAVSVLPTFAVLLVAYVAIDRVEYDPRGSEEPAN